MNINAVHWERLRHGARHFLIIVLVLSARIASAQNVAANPGFETGTTTGWSIFGSPTIAAQTTQVHSGIYAGLVSNRTTTYMGAAQSLESVFQTNQLYTISVWVRLVSGANQTIQLTMQKVDGSVTTFGFVGSASVSSTAWTQLSGTYTLNYTNTLNSLTLYAEMPTSSSASYYIDDLQVVPPVAPSTNGQCTVDWNTVYQHIDGFGASSAYRGTWTTTQANMLFSTNSGTGTSFDGRTNFSFNGVGLSLLRSKIGYNGSTSANTTPTTSETSIMQMAQARGAAVWSAPWTPPPGFKDSGAMNGGNYLGSGNNPTNLAYASQLANYVASMKNTYGVNLYAISVQNEPNFNTTSYESCVWTGAQIHDFVTNLYSALVNKGVGSTKILLPESESWSSATGLYSPTLADSNTAAVIGILAGHNYVANNVTGDTTTPAALAPPGKALWETEVSHLGSAYDGGIANAVYWAGRIHLFMTAAQANAWHYWWITGFSSDNSALTDTNGIPAKRMYALGQFARFVRPNFYRISITNTTGTALISAYKDSLSSKFAIVAVNSGPTDISQVFNFTNVSGVSNVVPWLTTSNLNLSSQAAVTVSNGSFSYTLPSMSIVTFAGQSATNSPPAPVGSNNKMINPGITLVITNVATDADFPPQKLTFSLLNAPTNGMLNPSNGVFVWRPLLSQANTTNVISTQVSDNGTPPLSATNSFLVVVNPSSRPSIDSASFSNGRVTLLVSGQAGPDYTLLDSTNLTDWRVVFTTNSPVLPMLFVDPNVANFPVRLYRIQLGP